MALDPNSMNVTMASVQPQPVQQAAPASPPAPKKAGSSLNLSGMGSQYIILLAVITGWGYSLVSYYANHVAIAQPIADGGWAALLIAFRADFGGTSGQTG